MLETINGFDLLLVIVIIGLVFKVLNLNDECNSYVQQIIKISWELNAAKKEQCHRDCPDCAGFTNPWWTNPNDLVSPDVPSECMYCLGIEEMVTGNECYCEVI